MYLLWRQGASVVVNLQVRDAAFNPSFPLATSQTGVFFYDGTKKPSFRTFRFPFVTHRVSGKAVGAWGKAPRGGRLEIQRRRKGRWHTLTGFHVRRGQVFTRNLKLRRSARVRARVGGLTSRSWHQG
jgi:hypothetical protein